MKTLGKLLAALVGFAGLLVTLYVSPLGEGLLTPVQESVGPRGARMRAYVVSAGGSDALMRVELRDSAGWLRASTHPWASDEAVLYQGIEFDWSPEYAFYARGHGFDLDRLRRKHSPGSL